MIFTNELIMDAKNTKKLAPFNLDLNLKDLSVGRATAKNSPKPVFSDTFRSRNGSFQLTMRTTNKFP